MVAPPLIFICYADAHSDRAIAKRIHRALDGAGMHPWCDVVDLLPGDKWDAVVPGVLKQVAVVLVLVTDTWSVGNGWYGSEEVALAIDRARRADSRIAIVPVRLDGVGPEKVPYGLRRLTEIEATGIDPRPIVAGLIRILERRSRSHTTPAVPVLDQRLADARARIVTLEAQGADRAEIEEAIAAKIAIKRILRAGGQLQLGDALDRYVLAERLGHGGFASVWRAWDPTRGEHVALKVLHGRWNKDASKVERFRRGVRQMARLKHPAVVPVLDADREDNGWHFFVMAWMPGGDLHRAITRDEAPLSADEGLRVVLQVTDALAVAHRRGIVHRDVKPRNILLDEDGCARLSDFDLVRALDTSGGTGTGAMGTFLYAAPEQLDRPQDVGPRADVYALGMTAVFVLTGRQPETMTKWQPDAAVARLPATPAVRACLLRAIALSDALRPAHAAAFAAELQEALGSASPGGTPGCTNAYSSYVDARGSANAYSSYVDARGSAGAALVDEIDAILDEEREVALAAAGLVGRRRNSPLWILPIIAVLVGGIVALTQIFEDPDDAATGMRATREIVLPELERVVAELDLKLPRIRGAEPLTDDALYVAGSAESLRVRGTWRILGINSVHVPDNMVVHSPEGEWVRPLRDALGSTPRNQLDLLALALDENVDAQAVARFAQSGEMARFEAVGLVVWRVEELHGLGVVPINVGLAEAPSAGRILIRVGRLSVKILHETRDGPEADPDGKIDNTDGSIDFDRVEQRLAALAKAHPLVREAMVTSHAELPLRDLVGLLERARSGEERERFTRLRLAVK